MADKKKKGLFSKKEQIEELEAELAKAKKETAAAQKAIKSQMDKNVKDKKAAQKALKDAEKKLADMENKMKAGPKKDMSKVAKAHKARKELLREKLASQKAKVIATHTVAAGETLSHIALKYYKHATPPYWKLLLEHNKEVLEGDEKKVRTGMELDIPELPADLKD